MASKKEKTKKKSDETAEKKNMLKATDSMQVGKGTVEIFTIKPVGLVDTLIMAVATDSKGEPVSVSQIVYQNVKPKSKKGSPSLVFEDKEKLAVRAGKRAEKRDAEEAGGKKADKKKAGKGKKKED